MRDLSLWHWILKGKFENSFILSFFLNNLFCKKKVICLNLKNRCKKASDMRLDLITEALEENSTLKHIAFDFSE